jgi:amino acid permease
MPNTKGGSIVIFIFIGFLRLFGAIDDAPFFDYLTGAGLCLGGFNGFFASFVVAGSSFQSGQAIGLTAAEMEQPEVHFLRAIRPVFCRIVIFYLLTMWRCDVVIKQDDPSLLCSSSDDPVNRLQPFI